VLIPFAAGFVGEADLVLQSKLKAGMRRSMYFVGGFSLVVLAGGRLTEGVAVLARLGVHYCSLGLAVL
jgi:hypothetical protein